jgi:hypothetical protein
MRRGRQPARAQQAAPPARLDKDEVAIEPDLALDSQAAVKIQKIDAAAQQNVLAVVDGLGIFARADFVRSGAPAQKSPRFQDSHRVPGAGQSCRR